MLNKKINNMLSSISPWHYSREKCLDRGKGESAAQKRQPYHYNGNGPGRRHIGSRPFKGLYPYFTTKEGRSGLGLTAAYSIIRGHHGYIKIVSEQGTGTTVSIYLPASLKEVFKNGLMEQAYKRGSGKVLLMDDQKLVRESSAEMLKETGYYVETARDGNEVIALYRRAMELCKPFDAVIMDLTVTGGMGGSEVIKELLKIDTQVNAIISSGYSKDSVMANYLDYGFRGMIEKPYTIQELVCVLEGVMNGGEKDSGLQNRLQR